MQWGILVLNSYNVTVALSECVVHLVHHCRKRGIGPVAEVNADRIEAIAKRPRHAEQANSAAGKINLGFGELALYLSSYWCGGSVAMVGVIKAENIGSVI